MPNIEYRGHVTLPVVPVRDWATVNRNDYDARLMRWIISGNGNKPTCERYDGFGTIDGVNVCRNCNQPEPAHKA